MPGVDSSPSSSSAYPRASDQTIVGFILIVLVIFAAMAMIFRSLFKLVRAARRLDRGVKVGEAASEQSTTAVNTQLDTVKVRFKAAIPPSLKRWDDIDDKLDAFERLTVKYFIKAKLFAVHTMQNLGLMEKTEDEAQLEGGMASGSRSRDAWRLTSSYFNETIGSTTQGAARAPSSQQEPDDPADTTVDSELESQLDDKSKLECSELTSPAPTLQYRDDKECTLKEVRRITAIDILEALAKVGRMSLSYRSAEMNTHRPDSLLPRVIRDSSNSVSDLKAKELRRLTAIDYLSKVVAAFPVDIRNKPLPHRPTSIVASINASERTQQSSSPSADNVTHLSQPASLSSPLSAISEESEESAPARPISLSASISAPILSTPPEANPTNQPMVDFSASFDANNKTPLMDLPATRPPSSHRRSMTLPLQPLTLSLSPSPSLNPKNEEEPALKPLELRPTSNTPHITALAELAASIVGEHPDAPPLLPRLTLTLSDPIHTLTHTHTPQVKYAWVGNSHRTTYGLVTRTNVPPTPPRLAMFESGDGGDAAFRSNAGTVRVAGVGSVLGASAGVGNVLGSAPGPLLGLGAGPVLGSGASTTLGQGNLGVGVFDAKVLEKEKEAESEVMQAGSGIGSEGQEGQVGATPTPVQIGSTPTPVQSKETTTSVQIGSTPMSIQIKSMTAPVQIAPRTPAPLPMQAGRTPAPMRNTRGKENRYLGGEAPRTVRRPPSHLRNVLCAI